MEINGSTEARVAKIEMKFDKKNDGKRLIVHLSIDLEEQRAREMFGDAFHRCAFGDMEKVVDHRDDGDATIITFGYDKKKPPRWLRPSMHFIDLWGNETKVQPNLSEIIAGDNDNRVEIKMQVGIDGATKELIGEIGIRSGDLAPVTFKSEQVPMKAEATQGSFDEMVDDPDGGGNGGGEYEEDADADDDEASGDEASVGF